MRRLSGPELPVTQEMRLSVMHDMHKFVVEEFSDWSVNTDGEVDLRVK